MSLKIRESILKRTERRYAEIEDVPTIGTVRIQSLSELERAKIEVKSRENWEQLRVLLVAYACVDEDGNRLFGDADIENLEKVDSCIITLIAEAIEDHCSVGALDDLESIKN